MRLSIQRAKRGASKAYSHTFGLLKKPEGILVEVEKKDQAAARRRLKVKSWTVSIAEASSSFR